MSLFEVGRTADLVFPALSPALRDYIAHAQSDVITKCCHGNVYLAVPLAETGALIQPSKLHHFSEGMGATLSCRAEWTSASDKGGKLDFSKSNEALLLEILKFVEDLCREHQREADVVFKRPFVWKTSLSLTNFESLKRGDEYTFRFVPLKCLTVMRFIWNNPAAVTQASYLLLRRSEATLISVSHR